jgi:phosphoribosylformylglycinamidine synthase
MLGLIEDIEKRCPMAFQAEGDEVFLLGASFDSPVESLSGSEYLRQVHGLELGRPQIDLGLESRLQRACLEAISKRLLQSAHDCSQGGLAVALAECGFENGLGLDGSFAGSEGTADAALFGEAQSRIVVSCKAENRLALELLARESNVPLTYLGRVSGDRQNQMHASL